MRTMFFVLFLAAVYGWVMNIVAIVHAGPVMEWGGMVIVRIIGVFVAPLGAVLGYC